MFCMITSYHNIMFHSVFQQSFLLRVSHFYLYSTIFFLLKSILFSKSNRDDLLFFLIFVSFVHNYFPYANNFFFNNDRIVRCFCFNKKQLFEEASEFSHTRNKDENLWFPCKNYDKI